MSNNQILNILLKNSKKIKNQLKQENQKMMGQIVAPLMMIWIKMINKKLSQSKNKNRIKNISAKLRLKANLRK